MISETEGPKKKFENRFLIALILLYEYGLNTLQKLFVFYEFSSNSVQITEFNSNQIIAE